MNRRTFMKVAAATPALAANAQGMPLIQGQAKPWPKIAYFDNPIANGLYPLQFVETLPLLVRGQAHTSRFEKETEFFRFIAQEWITDAVLFRGLEIKPRNPSDLRNRELQDSKFNLYVDDYRIFDGLRIGTFMKEGGGAFPYRDIHSTKCLYGTYRGWATKDGYPEDQFLGYFLPNQTCISAKVENCQIGSISVEIKCDMARYSAKK